MQTYDPYAAEREKEQEARNVERKKEWENSQKQNRAQDNYLLLLNDIMKFCLPILSLFSLILSVSLISKNNANSNNQYNKLVIPFITLIGLYLIYSNANSKEGEFSLTIGSTWKVGLISILLSMIFLFLWIKIQIINNNLDESQKLIILICTIIFTGGIAFFLTSNIDMQHFWTPWNAGKSAFIAYPWNLLSFIILNGFILYSLYWKEKKYAKDN